MDWNEKFTVDNALKLSAINIFNLFMGTLKIIWMQIKHWYKCFLHNFGCHFTEINKVLLNEKNFLLFNFQAQVLWE